MSPSTPKPETPSVEFLEEMSNQVIDMIAALMATRENEQLRLF